MAWLALGRKRDLSLFLAATVFLSAPLQALHAQSLGSNYAPSPPAPDYVSSAQSFCASPQFSQTHCAWVDYATPEWNATLDSICPFCGTMWTAPLTAPSQVGASDSYYQFAAQVVSLACQGPVTVRAVLQITQGDCAFLTGDEVPPAITTGLLTTRCIVQLPSGATYNSTIDEWAAAVNAPVTGCVQCDSCKQCPNDVGVWYSGRFLRYCMHSNHLIPNVTNPTCPRCVD